MRIIYLQNWDEKIDDSKFLKLNRFGDEVYHPQFDYTNIKGIISAVSNNIADGKNSLIIGNGIGSYMSFYISNLMKIPSLLFNPTFFYKNGGELKANYYQDQFIEKKIILPMKHDQIDTKRNFKYLKELGYTDQIKIVDNSTQNVLQEFFEMFFIEFYDKYKNIETQPHPIKKKKLSQYTDVTASMRVRFNGTNVAIDPLGARQDTA